MVDTIYRMLLFVVVPITVYNCEAASLACSENMTPVMRKALTGK